MCIAQLNTTTQPCGHRWFQLIRNCHPANNLSNCPERLRLEGWETRSDECPWCDAETPHLPASTHRLFSSVSSASSTVSAASASTTITNDPALTRQRSGSLGAISTLSRRSSSASTESARGQRHREMNQRLEVYMMSDPHEVLPSAGRFYPSRTKSWPALEEGPSDSSSVSGVTTGAGRGGGGKWRKGVRFSKSVFKS